VDGVCGTKLNESSVCFITRMSFNLDDLFQKIIDTEQHFRNQLACVAEGKCHFVSLCLRSTSNRLRKTDEWSFVGAVQCVINENAVMGSVKRFAKTAMSKMN